MTLALFDCPAWQEEYVDELPPFDHCEAWPVHRLRGCGVDGLLVTQDLTDEEQDGYRDPDDS